MQQDSSLSILPTTPLSGPEQSCEKPSAPPSPFLPGTKLQWAWDSTSLGWFKECPRKYYYHMILGLEDPSSNVHLRFGIEFHSALEEYENLKMIADYDHDKAVVTTVLETMKRTFDWKSDHPNKNRETLIRSIVWYLEQFKEDPAKIVVLANGLAALELSFKMDSGIKIDGVFEGRGLKINADGSDWPTYILCGHMDRLVEFLGDTYVTDRKTTKNTISPTYFRQYDPDNQMSLYTLAGKVIYNIPIKGVLLEGVQVAVGFTRVERGLTYRSEARLEEWLRDLEYWLRFAERCAESEYWPQNDKSCFGCCFREVCSADPSVREIFLGKMEKRVWNPLVPR